MASTRTEKLGFFLKLWITEERRLLPAHSINTCGRSTVSSCTRFSSLRPQNNHGRCNQTHLCHAPPLLSVTSQRDGPSLTGLQHGCVQRGFLCVCLCVVFRISLLCLWALIRLFIEGALHCSFREGQSANPGRDGKGKKR